MTRLLTIVATMLVVAFTLASMCLLLLDALSRAPR